MLENGLNVCWRVEIYYFLFIVIIFFLKRDYLNYYIEFITNQNIIVKIKKNISVKLEVKASILLILLYYLQEVFMNTCQKGMEYLVMMAIV
ncbi:hypothetical protein BSQ40_28520 [Serratia fonticola]|nr:hypothetical protein BSQ40_28520 [Serratia fonticola]